MAIIKPNNNTLSAITALPTGLGGKVLQVVTNTATTRFETTSTSYVAATGYTVAITPSATSSKVFVIISSMYDSKASGRIGYATLYRTISGGSATDIIGNTEGIAQVFGDGSRVQAPITLSALDSPNTTSAVTYQVYIRNYNGQVGFNNNEGETQLTAFEIAG